MTRPCCWCATASSATPRSISATGSASASPRSTTSRPAPPRPAPHSRAHAARARLTARARDGQICILAPEFSNELFPGTEGYNFGGVFKAEDVKAKNLSRPKAPAQWAFNALEGIFDRFRRLGKSSAERYFLFGHSAGAQFVHRHLAFMRGEASQSCAGAAVATACRRGGGRVHKAVAANAGWYTMPTLEERFPFGFAGAPPLNEDALEGFLAAPLVVLLGERDTDPRHPTLNTSAKANKQGPHRLARGEAFFHKGREVAALLGVECAWEKAYVPGAAHRNDLMAAHAAQMLFGPPTGAAAAAGSSVAAYWAKPAPSAAGLDYLSTALAQEARAPLEPGTAALEPSD